MDSSHLFGLELGQVIVHRNHVDALARQSIQIGREHRHQGLTFTGLHLSDVAPVKCGTALNLNVEVALT